MSASPLRAGSTWAGAAEQLARRVNRREDVAAVLRRLGLCLLVAAAVALGWRALASPPRGMDPRVLVGLLLALGAAAGLAWTVLARAARRPVAAADAAWALDRLAAAGGRGLAAAAVRGPAASEAAFAEPALAPPPRVRLHPPGGLVPMVGAGLLALLAFLAPVADARGPGAAAGSGTGGVAGAAGGPTDDAGAAAEARAHALDLRADAARRAREALNLPAEGPLDPVEVAERLSDPAARRRAAEAAGPDAGPATGPGDDPASADALARVIAPAGDNPTEAAAQRREAAASRAAAARPAVPAARREVVVRYLRLLEREAR